MKQLSVKKISILGLVLMGASAAVAAFLPKNNANLVRNGVMAAGVNTNNTNTCIPAASGFNCHNSASAGANGTSSNGIASTTAQAGNTTTGDVD